MTSKQRSRETPPRRPGTAFARSLLVLAGLGVGLAVGELVVRATGVAPEVARLDTGRFRLSDDPRIGYEPIPGYEYRGTEHSYRGRANSLGFRDREHLPEAAPGTFRILVLGDSIAAGLRIERFEDTFPFLLEQRLRERNVPAEVLNFGVNGYNTQQEVALLERRGLAFRPDLVLLAYCLNDVERSDGRILENLVAIAEGRAVGRGTNWTRRLEASALFRFLRYGLDRRGASADTIGDRFAGLEDNTVLDSLRRLGDLGREHDFEVLVAVFPYLRDLSNYDPRHAELHGYLRRFSPTIGARHLDLLEPFRRCEREGAESLAADNLHPSVAGHRCAARAMADTIASFSGDPG